VPKNERRSNTLRPRRLNINIESMIKHFALCVLIDREKMATLKYYSVDSDGKIQRLRRECPSETCGAGIFMAFHKDRQYCGKCHTTCISMLKVVADIRYFGEG
jgi:ribosomal protein S27AE